MIAGSAIVDCSRRLIDDGWKAVDTDDVLLVAVVRGCRKVRETMVETDW